MHLLVAAHDFYPDPGSGGTGRYVYETARRFVERGHHVSVLTRWRGDVPRVERVDGIDVRRYDLTVAGQSAADIAPRVPGAVRAVSDLIDDVRAEGEPDLLSFQGPVTSLLADAVVSDSAPRIATFHSPWPTEYRLRTRESDLAAPRRQLNVAVRKRLERFVLSRADGVVTLSEFMRDRFRRVYGLAMDATVVPGGVDTERFAPDVEGSDHITGDPAFLTVRRLSPRMGHELLLQAFERVVRRRPEARLYIAGDGPLRGRLERVAAELDVDDRATFLGYVPDADLPGTYAAADVFVLPTTELEGFGLATLEALASGTPVVGTPVGGTVELLGALDDGPLPERALLRSVSTDALARRMLAWATLPEPERQAANRTCRAYAERRYDWDRAVEELESTYSGLLAAAQS